MGRWSVRGLPSSTQRLLSDGTPWPVELQMDRIGLLHQLATLPAHPESVPINALVAIKGTPLEVCGLRCVDNAASSEHGCSSGISSRPSPPSSTPHAHSSHTDSPQPVQGNESPSGLDIARCVATARVLMPQTVVRLSAGRITFSIADQALCFLAGANSIFDGDKLLTTANNDRNEDLQMFSLLGLQSRPAFMPYASGNHSSSGVQAPAAQAAQAVAQA
jgi:biotin synthase